MSYTGEIEVGGPADRREIGDLVITKVAVGPMNNNAYLLTCKTTGEQVLIVAANDAGTILELIGDGGLARVITTHQHPDHWQALEEVVAETGAETVAGDADADGLPVAVTTRVNDGARIRVGTAELEVIHLAGCLLYTSPSPRDRTRSRMPSSA